LTVNSKLTIRSPFPVLPSSSRRRSRR
jgi:hypothetical protein